MTRNDALETRFCSEALQLLLLSLSSTLSRNGPKRTTLGKVGWQWALWESASGAVPSIFFRVPIISVNSLPLGIGRMKSNLDNLTVGASGLWMISL